MRSFYNFLQTRWVRTFLGVLMLALLIWFFGPMLGFGDTHPLVTETARIILIAACFVLWLVVNLIQELHARRKDKAMVEEVAAPDPAATASAEEVALLTDRLREAMHALKRAKLGGRRSGRHLYQLPWYMFIGPPGAGKTTALVNSGLNFPLADTQGPAQPLPGVGGTRNCDWWFTDQAVLIDTAGRYTTQDSQAAVDSAAWLGFLKLLKKYRRRQPLNGVLVVISLADLAQLGEAERLAHARAIRKRVRELHDQLGVRIPVYALFTKADLLAGFVEFFDGMGKEEREQVWGMTFPLDDGKDEGGAVARFGPEFDQLLARLNDRMLERVHQEPDIQRRRLIYGFPQQVASLRDTAAEFLGEIFRPSRLEARPLLRGVYLTSGTQDGTPIDRLLGAMAGQFGLQRQAVTAHSGQGRSYFLARLMRDVVFGEASLVSLDPKLEARTRWTYRGAWAACALVLLALAGIWTSSYFGNKAMIAQVHDETARYNAQYDELAKRGPNDADLTAALPPLATLRGIHGGYEQRELATPIALTFGLYQGHKLTAASVDAYYRALNGILLPRLLARLETQIAASLGKPDLLYEALKVYLILGRQGPLDRGVVTQWMDADFGSAFPGDDGAPVRDALLAHIKAMLERPLTAIPLNGPLVEQAREVLNKEPLASYSYNRIMRSPRIRSLPEWTVADNGGPASARVFELRSGKPLNTGVPGIFTWAGYHSVFLPLLPTVTKDIAEDGWVLGEKRGSGVGGTIAKANQLRRDVIALYLDDYARRWDAMLADVTIKPFGNLQAGLDELNLLSAPDSPLRDLLQSVDGQTQLSHPAATDQAASQAEAKAAKVGQRAAGFAAFQARAGLDFQSNTVVSMLGEAFGPGPGSSKPVDPAVRVDEHFRAIHDFVAGGDQKQSPMEAAIQKIQALYQNFNQVANAPNQGQALLGVVAGGAGGAAAGGGSASAAAQLQALSKDLPKPIAAMLQTVSQSSSAVTASGASQELAEAWKSKVLPLCQAAFGRYPFVAGSAADVPPDDFAHLLGPGGMIDQFFDQNLKPFVDTDTTPWHWQAGEGAKLALSPGSLAQFERAAMIRDGLFSGGGQQMVVRFQLVPVALDPQLAQVSLDIAGQTLTYSHGPTESQSFIWPGPGGKTLVRLTMTPANGNQGQGGTVVEKDGPWALLRLLDAGRVIPSGQPDKFRLVFTSPAGSATFDLNASSVRNPFTLSALRSFRCPARL